MKVHLFLGLGLGLGLVLCCRDRMSRLGVGGWDGLFVLFAWFFGSSFFFSCGRVVCVRGLSLLLLFERIRDGIKTVVSGTKSVVFPLFFRPLLFFLGELRWAIIRVCSVSFLSVALFFLHGKAE